jgi:hypothetical protein
MWQVAKPHAGKGIPVRLQGAAEAWKSHAMSEIAATNRFILLIAGVFGVLLALTGALWVHYGTAVFFEVIRAGFVACFG